MFLGRLEQSYGDEANYVHLTRDREATARSFARRFDQGIIRAYRQDILLDRPTGGEPLEVCLDYCDTVNANIEHFLRDKTRTFATTLEEMSAQLPSFWEAIGVGGDLAAALAELELKHNASQEGLRARVRRAIRRT